MLKIIFIKGLLAIGIKEKESNETALLQAQLNYSQAIYNYMVAVYALEALQGEGLPSVAK